MGNLGSSIQKQVNDLINDSNLRSTLTLTPKTVTIGSKGGYNTNTEVDGTETTVYAIPSNYVKNRTGLKKFGDLREGEVRFLVKASETIDTDDSVTFDSNQYHIREIKNIYFNEFVIAQSIILSRKVD